MNDERMKIMLVEDDKALAGEISSFLRRWGYETMEACQFDKILEEFSQYMPQLVLMDINLPYPRTQEMKMEMPFLDLKSYIWGEVYQEYLEVRK